MSKPKIVSQTQHPGSLELTEEIIRRRAFQLFEERGCEIGHDLDDWLQAEAEIMGTRKPVLSAEQEQKLRRAAVA
jgi:DUF2934 family protein